MNLFANNFKRLLNIYPPYLGAGIKIDYINKDWDEMSVSMRVRWYNRNAVGTHFGGSIYSMIDPHLMLLLMRKLGKGYWIWDRSAEIDFLKATKKRITAHIQISDEQLQTIRDYTATGEKYFPEFSILIHDSDGELIAKAKKILYIKKRLS